MTSRVPFHTKPPLRLAGTSPQGEAYKAPIEGSCRQSRLRGGEEKRRAEVEYGCRGDHWSHVVVLKSDVEVLSCTKPPLRPWGTSPQGEAYKAPIEGSCRRSRLRGGEGKRRAEAEYGCRGNHWSPVVVLKSDVKGAVPHETTTPPCWHLSSRRGI